MSLPICGPKLSMCCLVLSVWGVVMLALLGVALRLYSPAFAEDLPIDEKVWEHSNFDMGYIHGLYDQASTNCFIAAGLYGATFAISLLMWRLNQRNNYTTA